MSTFTKNKSLITAIVLKALFKEGPPSGEDAKNAQSCVFSFLQYLESQYVDSGLQVSSKLQLANSYHAKTAPIIKSSWKWNQQHKEIKNGKLVNPNKTWIYKYIIILSVYFLLIDDKILSKFSKVGNIILLLYPLIFPLDEYFIHRIYSLCLLVYIKWYINISY